MDKPSDYGSDIRGSNPLRGTNFQSIENINNYLLFFASSNNSLAFLY